MKQRRISRTFHAAQALFVGLMLSQHSQAATTTVIAILNPTDDGSIYSGGSLSQGTYVLAAGSIRGVVVFPLNLLEGSIQSAFLEVNPYGLPIAPSGHLYGMEATGGAMVSGQYSGGTDLGSISFPSNIAFGGVRRFDVTGFMQSLNTDFAAFRIETSGTMVLSSLEFNYGKPAQLVVTLVPEPSSMVLGGLTMGILLLRRRRNFSITGTP